MNFGIVLLCSNLFAQGQYHFSAKLQIDRYKDIEAPKEFVDNNLNNLLITISKFIYSNNLDDLMLTIEVISPILDTNIKFSKFGSEMRMRLWRFMRAAGEPVSVRVMIPLRMPGRPLAVDVKKQITFETLDEALVWADQQMAEELPEDTPWKIEIISRTILPDGEVDIKNEEIVNPRMEFK